jgi:predicted acetyltransferase
MPEKKYERSYRSYIAELGDEERYPFPLDFPHEDFPALLKRLEDLAQGTNVPEGYVPSTTFWLVEGLEILGVSNLRHYLNKRIRHSGGHIGLGIRPACRGRGLGSLLMTLTIQKARERENGELHIHCHKENRVSARIIINNGGVLESELQEEKSVHVVQRYVVGAV